MVEKHVITREMLEDISNQLSNYHMIGNLTFHKMSIEEQRDFTESLELWKKLMILLKFKQEISEVFSVFKNIKDIQARKRFSEPFVKLLSYSDTTIEDF